MAVPAYAGQGYRGTAPFGCQAYINGSSAWTRLHPSKASGYIHTKHGVQPRPTRTVKQQGVDIEKVPGSPQIARSVNCTQYRLQTYWN